MASRAPNRKETDVMKFPAAIVTAVLIWSTARYLPPYYLEMRKMDLEEEKVDLVKTRAHMLLKASQAREEAARTAAESPGVARFY
jgi:hypothetical protein